MYESKSYERKTIHANGNRNAPRNHGGGIRKPAQPKGHDAVLKAIQDDGRTIHITMQSGETLSGNVVARDKFTISVLVNKPGEIENATFVIYKHAIESFWAVSKAQVTE